MKCLFLLVTNFVALLVWSQPTFLPLRQESDVTLLASPDSGIVRAVIIGVGAFESSDIPPLPNAEAEANRFADSLQRTGVVAANQVILLTDREATLVQIAMTLDWLVESSWPGDQALIYLNGYWVTETYKKRNQDYFIAYDAVPRFFHLGGAFPALMLSEVIRYLEEAHVQVWLVNHTTVRMGPFKN